MSEKEYIFVGNAQLKTRDYIKQLEKDNREKDKEIERLNEEKESWKRLATKNFNEAEDYKAIIKEVREYIEKNIDNEVVHNWYLTNEEAHELLEILDKENKECGFVYY